MRLYQLETLAEAFVKAYYENDLLGVRPEINGDISLHLTANGLENLFGDFTAIEKISSDLYQREVKVGRFKFYCVIEEDQLTEQDKKDLRKNEVQDDF